MSSLCPKCQNPIEASFGMTNCPACGVLVFVGMDGGVEIAAIQTDDLPVESSSSDDFDPTRVLSHSNDDLPLPSAVSPMDMGDSVKAEPMGARDAMKRVEAFGNSSASDGRDGTFTFDVIISGVDSIKIKKDLRDSFSDKRFMWNPEELIKNIKNGELRIRGLTAIKASVLIHRLKELPLEIRWEQFLIAEGKGSSEVST